MFSVEMKDEILIANFLAKYISDVTQNRDIFQIVDGFGFVRD